MPDDENSAGGDEHLHGGSGSGGHSHGAAPEGHFHGHGVEVERGFVRAPRPEGAEIPPLARGAGRGHVLFFDMQSGIAGDMTIAGFLDLGVPVSVVEEAIACLGLQGVGLSVETGYAGAIGCTHVDVSWPQQEGERSYTDIRRLIEDSRLTAEVKRLAQSIFLRLARAEANVHKTTLDLVHFHEVGAVDAIVDIVGAAAATEYLGATVKASPVPLGRGFITCRHGRLPLPAPAALECLASVPTVDSGLQTELVTPTGAAIVATLATEFGQWFPMSPVRTGWGAGTRGLADRPNVLRMVLGQQRVEASCPAYALLETNLDDMTGEVIAHALERLLEEGALDAWVTPITMKKGRPAVTLTALTPAGEAARVADILLAETSSIGVRQSLVTRKELPREMSKVETPWGPVRVKQSGLGTPAATVKPEVADCAEIARSEGIPLRDVLSAVHRILADRRGD